MPRPNVIWIGVDMQVCVPAAWTDEEVAEFAESHEPRGWRVQTDQGMRMRTPCVDIDGYVHVTLRP